MMSIKFPKRLSSNKQKLTKDNVAARILHELGLDDCLTAPLDPTSMVDISTWTVEKQTPVNPKDLPNAFLQRLWLFCQDARSTCCQISLAGKNDDKSNKETHNNFEEGSQFAMNPLDLVTAVFMSANTFLQYEMANHMMQCQFAIPLVLPNIDAEEPSNFLLWPLRGIISQWWENCLNNRIIQEGNLASSLMPLVSCVRLGHCSISKSQVLNHILGGLQCETFLHKGMNEGHLPKRLSNGLVEIGWHLPTGDPERDNFCFPVVISNLRGDASNHQKSFHLLCKASSLVVIFCGDLRKKDRRIIHFYKDMARMLILIDISGEERNEEGGAGFVTQKLEDNSFPEARVLSGKGLNEKELADQLHKTLKKLLPHEVKLVTLEAAANLAAEIGLHLDEGWVCKNAMVAVEKVLKGFDEGSTEFKQKQLPLQGSMWKRLSEIEKKESKPRKKTNETNSKFQSEKKRLWAEMSSYKMTHSMKIFTEALFTADQVERTYFLSWLRLRLQITQTKEQNSLKPALKDQQTEKKVWTPNDDMDDSDSFCTDSTFEEDTVLLLSEEENEKEEKSQKIEKPEKSKEPTSQHINAYDPVLAQCLQISSNEKSDNVPRGNNNEELSPLAENGSGPLESETNIIVCQNKQPDASEVKQDRTYSGRKHTIDVPLDNPVSSCLKPFEQELTILGLEHFLREMGLIFELTHISPGSGSHNVSRLPSLATDLLLYGIPLELMDGDASNLPFQWLSSVFTELQRRLPREKYRTRVLTSLGVCNTRNSDVLSALFNVKFHKGRKRSTKGIYMAALCLPDHLKIDLDCDLLLLIDLEGLGSVSPDDNTKTVVCDHELATVAASLGDILLQNISCYSGFELERTLGVLVSALLRIRERRSVPPCQFLFQDVGINSLLQASQLKRVSDMLRSEADGREDRNAITNRIDCIRGPWFNESFSQPVDSQYSDAMLHFKKNLFELLKMNAAKSKASSLRGFMKRLCAISEAVKTDSFSIHLQNLDMALEFSLLCTKICNWKNSFLENMDSWIIKPTKKILNSEVKVFDSVIQDNLLMELKEEATDKVNTGVINIKSKVEADLMKNEPLKIIAETIRPILISNLSKLQEKETKDVTHKLDTISEGHFISTLIKKFQTSLKEEQESLLHALIKKCKSTYIVPEDKELEEDFEDVWSQTLSIFDFKPSDTDDIPTRVNNLLKENLITHGLLKHLKKLDVNGQNSTTNGFQVLEEHFGYRNRVKYQFSHSHKKKRLKAQQVAGNIIKGYNQFVADKYEIVADFSDSYITELLENIEKALKENTLETRSAFEVDLKVYLCNSACRDFQNLHNRFAKERKLLVCINEMKSMHSAEFIYNFRKREQCHRLAQTFTSMVFKPTVSHYLNRALGRNIIKEILAENPECQSKTFDKCLLDDVVKDESFESSLEYPLCYNRFSQREVQEAVKAHLSQPTNIRKLQQQRLGEIVDKMAAAVNQTTAETTGVLINAQPLLKRVCDILERNEGVHVNREPLIGPLFTFTTQWECYIKCLLQCLATMQIHFAQEFSQTANIKQLLDSLSVQPHNCFYNQVQGCDLQCPQCKTPCDKNARHRDQEDLLHQWEPKPSLSNSQLYASPSYGKYSENTNEDNNIQNKDNKDLSNAGKDLNPDANIPIGNQSSSD